MRGDPGSSELAAARVARALLERGRTNLQAKLGAYVGAFGGLTCFQTAAVVRDHVLRSDGKPYHVESIRRCFRELAAFGELHNKQVFTGQRPDDARYKSPHGTTEKRIIWTKLGIKNPVTRREQAEVRARQRANERAYAAAHRGEQQPSEAAPRHSSPVTASPPLDPVLAELAARIGERIERRELAREQHHDAAQMRAASLMQGETPKRGPPDG